VASQSPRPRGHGGHLPVQSCHARCPLSRAAALRERRRSGRVRSVERDPHGRPRTRSAIACPIAGRKGCPCERRPWPGRADRARHTAEHEAARRMPPDAAGGLCATCASAITGTSSGAHRRSRRGPRASTPRRTLPLPRGPRPQETVGLVSGVSWGPSRRNIRPATGSLQAEDWPLADGPRIGHADPVRCSALQGPSASTTAAAAQHSAPGPAPVTRRRQRRQADGPPVPDPHAESLGGRVSPAPDDRARRRPSLDQRCPERSSRSAAPPAAPPRCRQRTVSLAVLLPTAARPGAPHVRLAGEDSAREERTTEVHVDPGLLEELFDNSRMQPHPVLGHLGPGARNAEAAHGLSPPYGEARGVARPCASRSTTTIEQANFAR